MPIVEDLKTVLQESEGFGRNARRELWEKVADGKMGLKGARGLMEDARAFIEKTASPLH